MRFTMDRSASLALLGALCTSQLACSAIVSPDPSRLGRDEDANAGRPDAYAPDVFVPEGTDANFPDAFAELPDAYVAPPDAYVMPGVDAFAFDAFTPPDAYTIPDARVSPDAFAGDAGCTAGPDRCVGNMLSRCVGGAVTTSMCALGCADTEARCRTMVPSNVETALLYEGTTDFAIASSMTINTSTCMRVVTQADGGDACVFVVRNMTVASGATLRVAGRLPVIILASGTVTIDGAIDLSAEGTTPGAGGYSGSPAADTARGPLGGDDGAFSGMWLDSGGGGGGHCGSGGNGGGAGSIDGGSGGGSIATTLQPLTAGSGGGAGQGGGHSAMDFGLGGAGGGAIQISSAVAIRVSGRIDAGGGAGQGGRGTVNWGAGGGGGAGGGILLEAPVVAFTAGASILATGGGGGAGQNGTSRPAGENGRTLNRPASGGRPTGSRAADGGDSGGGATADGLDGETNTLTDGNGGGGGGGIGCIVLRAVMPPTLSSRMSPSGDGLESLPLMTR
jgi:hypothetical protein